MTDWLALTSAFWILFHDKDLILVLTSEWSRKERGTLGKRALTFLQASSTVTRADTLTMCNLLGRFQQFDVQRVVVVLDGAQVPVRVWRLPSMPMISLLKSLNCCFWILINWFNAL